jgi:hypothetical protein
MMIAAIPPTTPPTMAPTFELPPDEDEDEELVLVGPTEETPEGPSTVPGPISDASRGIGVRPPRKDRKEDESLPRIAYDLLGFQVFSC